MVIFDEASTKFTLESIWKKHQTLVQLGMAAALRNPVDQDCFHPTFCFSNVLPEDMNTAEGDEQMSLILA